MKLSAAAVTSQWPRRLTLLLLIGSALGIFGWFWWLAHRKPDIRYLAQHQSALWIVYPVPPQARAQWAVERRAIFRRSVTLAKPTEAASLVIRAFKEYQVSVNGVSIDLPAHPADNWKEASERDIASYLRAGQNDLVVTVKNADGPPALWLALTGGDWSLESDGQWQVTLDGAVEQPAAAAQAAPEIRRGNPVAGGEETLASLWARWRTLLGFALLSLGAGLAVMSARRGGRAGETPGADALNLVPLAVLGAAILWCVLFWNNLQSLLFPIGFDAEHHLAYIQYIQQHKALPLANQGWETHQPPLYYVVSALALGLFGLSAQDTGAVVVLRILALVAAIIQIGLVGASLRLLFPDNPRRQVIGLLVAAFLPMHIYIAHYESNDLLAAVLATASVYVCLTVLVRLPLAEVSGTPRPNPPPQGERGPESLTRMTVLGVCLGAALLTKVNNLVIIPVVLGTLAGQLIVRRRADPRVWLRRVGLPLAICVAVSGWHFYRVWHYFGTPLVGSYDPISGFNWWQMPGYSTAAFYARFGRSLVAPFFAGYQSLADGLYSTLWGDGLWGGVGDRASRTPWNYQLMSAGYLLALAPTLAVLLGAGVSLVQLIRRPRAQWFLLAGLGFGMTAAVVYHFLRLPYACHIKAFYAFPALIPFCAFAGWGFDILMSRWKALGVLTGALLATWGITSYASYWVKSDGAATRAWIGLMLSSNHRYSAALESYDSALRADPANEYARVGLARVLLTLGRTREAREQLQRGLDITPDSFHMHFGLALALAQEDQIGAALEHLRETLQLAPDFQDQGLLGGLLVRKGEMAPAIQAFRHSLGTLIGDVLQHRGFGDALVQDGQTTEAIEQYRAALRLQPQAAETLSNLARILATNANPEFRNGLEAVRLATQAAGLTNYQNALVLDTLAAAYAEAGQFREAEETQERALNLPGMDRQIELAKQLREHLQLYQAKKPYHEAPKQR